MTTAMTDEEHAELETLIQDGVTLAQYARTHGITPKALSKSHGRWRRNPERSGVGTVAPTVGTVVQTAPLDPRGKATDSDKSTRDLERSRAKASTERRRRWAAEDAAELADKRAGITDALHRGHPILPPIAPAGPKSRGRNRGLPVLVCSDWHTEEVVDPKTINYRNEYNPAIAERRIAYLFEGAAWMLEQWSGGWDIDEMVVGLLGDLISGYIHDELLEGNAMSPVEAVLFAQGLAERGLLYLLERCPQLKRITVPCCFGNHGRTTQRRRVATAAANSFEWLMYRSLEKRFADDERIDVRVANGAHLYSDLYGLKVRWTHGDDVRYYGGVGGLSIPLKKAHQAWASFEPVDLTILGHYHTYVDYGFAVANGSVIGFNPYALSIKGEWEPPRQAMFLVDEEWGKRLVTPIYCDPDRRGWRAKPSPS